MTAAATAKANPGHPSPLRTTMAPIRCEAYGYLPKWYTQFQSKNLSLRKDLQARTDKGPAMNHSIYTVDKATHLKVVVAGLTAGIAIVATALTVHLTHPDIDVQKARTLAVQQPHPAHALTKLAQR